MQPEWLTAGQWSEGGSSMAAPAEVLVRARRQPNLAACVWFEAGPRQDRWITGSSHLAALAQSELKPA